MKKYIGIAIFFILMLITLTGCGKTIETTDDGTFKIVSSFYPTYIMLLNITEGAQNVSVENMTSNNVGCLHDYTLTTNDLIKLEKADVFVTSGVEKFMVKISSTYPELMIINPIAEIPNMIMEEGEPNYHMWLDLTNYMAQVRLISEELIKLNPENRDVYVTKTNEYLDELEDLQEKAKQALTTTKKCVNFDEAIEYLKYDMNLDMYTVKTDHENNGLSAETVSNIIDYMKQNNIKIILTAKGSNNKNANVIAAETGAKIYQLDTQITGNIDKDEYITAMDYNIEQIKSMEE